jgi:hypothetical protein
MIYNINTVITTAPKIPTKPDTVKTALLLGVVVPCPPCGVICSDFNIVQNVSLS